MFQFGSLVSYLPYLAGGVPITFGIALVAFTAGAVAGLPMALLRIGGVPGLAAFATAWIEFFRTTPPLVHIAWAYYVLPQSFGIRISDTAVVVAALAASVSAQMAEVFRGGFLAIQRGQHEAAIVLGLAPWQRLWYVILPQTLRLIMGPACNTAVSLIKDTSLAAIIAVPELMNRGEIVATRTFRPLEVLSTVAIFYFVLTYPVALLAGRLERVSRKAF